MNQTPASPEIRAELVAAKIAAAKNFQYTDVLEEIDASPKLIELLWFLQFMSFQPGGLNKLAQDLVRQFPERLGTAAMHRFGARAGQRYSLEERKAIYQEIPLFIRKTLQLDDRWNGPDVWGINALSEDRAEAYLAIWALETAKLPHYLRSLAEDPSKNFLTKQPIFFHDIIGALFEFMDARAASKIQAVAETKVRTRLIRECNFALSQQGLVFIKGIERIGKSTAVEAFCNAWPGRARLIRVPSSNDMPSMFRAVAHSLGIDCPPGTSMANLQHTIEYTYQHSGLMIILDESHFCWPVRYSQGTKPVRLDWIRTQFIDMAVPVVMVITPQEFEGCQKFEKKTNYRSKQFYGRKCLEVTLSSDIDEADLLSVARNKLPGLAAPLLKLVAARAMRAETWLQGVEAISRRSKFYAEEGGRAVLQESDIRQACDDIAPPPPVSTPARSEKRMSKLAAEALQKAGRPAAAASQSTRISPEDESPLNRAPRGDQLEALTIST